MKEKTFICIVKEKIEKVTNNCNKVFKFLNMNKIYIIICILIIFVYLLPILLINDASVLGYVGTSLSGICTLGGVVLTIIYQSKQQRLLYELEKLDEEQRVISGILSRINISTIGTTFLEIRNADKIEFYKYRRLEDLWNKSREYYYILLQQTWFLYAPIEYKGEVVIANEIFSDYQTQLREIYLNLNMYMYLIETNNNVNKELTDLRDTLLRQIEDFAKFESKFTEVRMCLLSYVIKREEVIRQNNRLFKI